MYLEDTEPSNRHPVNLDLRLLWYVMMTPCRLLVDVAIRPLDDVAGYNYYSSGRKSLLHLYYIRIRLRV